MEPKSETLMVPVSEGHINKFHRIKQPKPKSPSFQTWLICQRITKTTTGNTQHFHKKKNVASLHISKNLITHEVLKSHFLAHSRLLCPGPFCSSVGPFWLLQIDWRWWLWWFGSLFPQARARASCAPPSSSGSVDSLFDLPVSRQFDRDYWLLKLSIFVRKKTLQGKKIFSPRWQILQWRMIH